MANNNLNLRHPVQVQHTAAVISNQAKQPISPFAGTSFLNASRLSVAGAPTSAIRSNQSKIPIH
jgi:hypothetical protein